MKCCLSVLLLLLLPSFSLAATLGYWRFEEGPAGALVYNSPARYSADSSGNGNHGNSASLANSASYSGSIPLSIVPQTGAPNSFSLYTGPGGPVRDLYTAGSINSASLSSFTIEASVQFDGLGTWQTFLGRDANFSPLSALYFQLCQDSGLENHVAIKIVDSGMVLRQVFSREPVVAGRWYHFAVLGDSAAHTLALLRYDTLSESYVLEGSTAWNGPMASQGGSWTLGRGMYNGVATDTFSGRIDEARISDTLLNTNQLLWFWATPSAVRIAAQPTNATVGEFAEAAFSVGLAGRPPFSFQWFRDDAPIADATNSAFALASARTNDHGARFRVVASNVTAGRTNSVTSSNAFLSVLPDRTPPALAGARWLGQPRAVVVLFSEPVEPASALCASNYAISGGIVVTEARPGPDSGTIVLATTPLLRGVSYTVTVSGVRDASAAGNVIAPGSQAAFTCDFASPSAEGCAAFLRLPLEPLGPCSRRTPFVLSEIHYHPLARADGRNAEFIELFNSQPWPEDLSGFRLSGSVDFVFPSNTVIAARGFLVVAASPADLRVIYGVNGALGPWTQTNGLPNDSGTIRLRHRQGSVLLDVNYADQPPWPVAPDGGGHSLVLARPSYGEANPRAWDASQLPGGSPGADEVALPLPAGLAGVVVNELLAHPFGGGLDFVELFNSSTQSVDLAGCVLTDDPGTNKFVFPANSLIDPLGFLSLEQDRLGFGLKAGGDTLWLRAPDGARVLDVARFGPQEQGIALGRSPDGAPSFSRLELATPGAANAPSRLSPVILSEIMFQPVSGDPEDEFVELFNRSADPVDLSGWHLGGGIDFLIPSNTVLGADSRIVLARNVARLLTNYSHLTPANTLGNFGGKLGNGGDLLQLSKPVPSLATNGGRAVTNYLLAVVDQVDYGAGGRWGRWADGGGSSLELLDSRADKRLPPAWADSDESGKSGWKTVEATGVLDLGIESADSLQILLLGSGECLVDNVEVIPRGGSNLIPNPGFESGLDGWFAQGSHSRSYWEAAQGCLSSRSLHVVATDRGDTGANRIRAALTAALAPGQTATIRAQVKWLRGAPEVLFRLHGNYLEAPGRSLATSALGTPGLPNSRAVPNTGPAITDVIHRPVLPGGGQAVTVFARLTDPDPLAAVTLLYRIDPGANWLQLPMLPGGAGLFSAQIPPQPAGTLAAFFIVAGDAGSPPAASRFPPQPPRECLVRWGEPLQGGALGVYRLWMTAATLNEWTSREKLSNDPLDTTFVYGDFRVIYNIGAQFSGSPWHSQFYDTPVANWCNYALFMPGDDRLLGRTDFRIYYPGNDADDETAQREQFGLWLCQQLGLPFNHQRYVHFFVNGLRRGTILEDAQTPDPDTMDQFFPGAGGELYKVTMWHEFEDNAASYVATPAAIQNFTTTGGAKKLARYRWIFSQRGSPESATAYTNLFALVDAANWPGGSVVSRLDLLADTDNWMRLFAFEHAVGNWDSWGNGNGQNVFLARPNGARWLLMPVDADILLGSAPSDGPTTDLFKCTDPVLGSLYTVPVYRRAYWRALLELANGPFLPASMSAWLDPRYQGLTANGAAVGSPQPIKNYVAARRDYILSQAAAVASPFTVSGGANLAVSSNVVTLGGTAPIEVETFLVNDQAWPVTWTTISNWTLRLPLQPGSQSFVVRGLNHWGAPVTGASATFSIDCAAAPESPVGKVLFNEIMCAPPTPRAEYVELFNASTNTAFDLSGWIVNGLGYTFPVGSLIAPRGLLVLAKDLTAFWNAYGMTTPAFDQYEGNLQADGETLTLIRPGATPADDLVVDRVTYGAAPPWPAGAAGQGSALQLIDPAQDNSRVGNWSDNMPVWRFFTFTASCGSVTKYSKFSLYDDNGGEVFLDDLALVVGSAPATGTNYLKNGDFETPLSPPWTISGLATNTAIASGPAHSGAASLHFVGSTGAGSVNHFYQYLTNVVPAGLSPNSLCTLSFWYLSGGSGTLNVYLNASFRTNIAFGSGGGAAARLSPGATNTVAAALPPIPPLYLNEVLPLNLTGLTDNLGEREPWIELHNAGANALSLDNLFLAGQSTNLLEWRFPTGASIQPGEHLLLWADGEPAETSGTNWHTGFRLRPASGSVVLTMAVSNTLVVLDYFTYANLAADQSFGAWPEDQTSYRQTFFYPTPRASNNPASPPVALFINEWMAASTRAFPDPADGDFDDWFEIYNPGLEPVDLEHYCLTDNLADPGKFRVPPGIAVPGRGYLLVWADEETSQTRTNGDLHVNFKIEKSGEVIALYAPDGTLVDAVAFGPQTANFSMGRYPDGGFAIDLMSTPTPKGVNAPPPLEPAFLSLNTRGSSVILTIQTTPGFTYAIDAVESPDSPFWTQLGESLTATTNTLAVTDSILGVAQRFYRARRMP